MGEVLRLHCELQALRTAMFADKDSASSPTTSEPEPVDDKRFASCCGRACRCKCTAIVASSLAVFCAPCRLLARACGKRRTKEKIRPFQNSGVEAGGLEKAAAASE